MANGEIYVLGDDLPKQNPWRDDRLGYRPFCERIAKVVIGLRAPNGYVVGLHGEWGSGKSTALNFVRAFLEKHNQETDAAERKITVVDFRPWIVSGHQDLIAAFFKVMTESLGVRPSWLKRQWNRLLRALRIGGDPLIDAVATVAVTVDPSAGAASSAMAPVAKKSLGAMVDTFLADPSLQTAYEALKQRLDDSRKRFLVTIDDLDRLQDDEIRSIMQMVKTVGQLPNVIYILAYDRSIIWKALDDNEERDGPHFAEKIVQQEIELPKPSKGTLLSVLDSELGFLAETPTESMRWHYVVRDGVRRWIRNARDVLRLTNATKFSWPALKGEIDPQDLVAMEGLRLFDPVAFDWIRWNRDFLFSEGRFMMSDDKARNEAAASLSARLPERTKNEILQVLSVLFPQKAKHFFSEKVYSSSEPHREVVRRRGIGCEAGYDAYFGLHPSSEAIPKAVIDHIVSVSTDEDAVVRAIQPFIAKTDRAGEPMISQLLEELRFRFGGAEAANPTQAMLDAMFRIGEDVFRIEHRAPFSISPRSQVTFLVEELLKAWGSEEAGKRLLAAFEKSNSVAFNADIFVERAREFGLMPSHGSPSSPLITKDDLDVLGSVLLRQIEMGAEEGTLANAPFYWDIARSWKYLGGGEEPKRWLSAGMDSSADFLAKVALGLVSFSISSRGRSYSMKERPDPDFYDLGIVYAACRKHLAGNELNSDQRSRVQVVADRAKEMLTAQQSETTAEVKKPAPKRRRKG